MAESVLKVYDSVIVASLEEKKIHAVHEPLAGIILAAGESRRFGTPKQLLEWKGQPFVRVVAQTALDAGLSPVVLVTGSSASQVEQASGGLDLQIVRNDEWKDGQASSIKMGISSLPSNCGGAIFLLVDQPQLSTSIIHALKEKHAEGLHPVIAPMILDRRGNPVLFDRETFTDLLELEGDVGGRAIFHKHRVEYLPWHDDSLLLDVDTPEQYQRLLALEDL
jgi:molybdenum cofactor cytidylyltransferase